MRINYFLFLFISLLFFTGCAKEVLENRLTQTWKVIEAKEDNVDRTSDFHILFPNYRITFFDNKNFREVSYPFGVQVTVNGTWEFIDNQKRILLTDPNDTRIFKIITLHSSKLEVLLEAENQYFHLIPE